MIDIKTSKMFRGLAILIVMASHFAAGMYDEPVRPALKEFISVLGIYGVDIFMVLSGYGMVKAAQKKGITSEFVIKRIISTYVPYILIVGFFKIIDGEFCSAADVGMFLIGYEYWYMCVLFAFYILFMIVYKIDRFRVPLITVGIVAFSILLYKIGMSDFWVLSNGAFLIGIYAAELEKKYGSRTEEFISKINLSLIAMTVMLIFAYIYSVNGAMWSRMCTSMSFSVMVLAVCAGAYGGGVILPSIGKYSMYIYLLHLRLFWKFVMWHVEWGYFKSAVVAGIFTLVIATAVGYAMEFNLGLLFKFISGRIRKQA